MKLLYYNMPDQNIAVLNRMPCGTASVVFFNLKKIPVNTRDHGARFLHRDSGTRNIHADMNVGIGFIKPFYGIFYTKQLIHNYDHSFPLRSKAQKVMKNKFL